MTAGNETTTARIEVPAFPAAQPVLNHGIITASVMLATIMQVLDTTIANVALPRMQGTLAATQDEMGWVLTSYIVAAAIATPLSGWLAGKIGRRWIFLASIAGFTVASALCGLSTSLPEMVLFRLLQGVSGAALVPLSQAVLFDINSPKDFARVMAFWGISVTLGPILGPVLGGWLTENYSWRRVFYINLPLGILAFLGLLWTLPENRLAKSSSFDFFGFTTLSLAVGSVQILLDRGQLLDWFSSSEIIVETVLAGLGFYLFIVHMFSAEHPFLNPALLRDRNFVASNIFIFLVGVLLFATLALLPPMLQNQLSYPVVLTGLVMAPRGAGTMLAAFFVGRVTSRFDTRWVIAAGFAITAGSLWQMTQYSPLMGSWPIISAGVVQGVGIGLVYIPLSAVAFSTLPADLRNEGTAFFSLVRNVGSSVGISVVIFLLTQNTQRQHSSLSSNVTPYNVFSNPAITAGHFDVVTAQGQAALNAAITDQSAMIAYLDDFKLLMVLTLVMMPLLLLFERPRRQSDQGA